MSTEHEERERARRGKRQAILFLVKFLVLVVLFEGVFATLLASSAPFETYLAWNARLSAGLLSLFGHEVSATGVSLYSPEGSLEIRRGCDALQPSAIFLSAVLAFAAPIGWKLAGAAIGVVILLVVNLARIVTLYLLFVHANGAFQTAHEALWPTTFILLALFLWLLWVKKLPAP